MKTFGGFLIIILDKIVSLCLGIRKFTNNPKCILRYRPVRLKEDVILPNGKIIKRYSFVIEIHLWNEHLPPIPKGGVDLNWGRKFYYLLINSFIELLNFLDNSRWKNVEYVFGETAFFFVEQEKVVRFLNKLGFIVLPVNEGKTHGEEFYRFLQNGYNWCLIYAYNKESLKRKKDFFYVRRYNLWGEKEILREKLIKRVYKKIMI